MVKTKRWSLDEPNMSDNTLLVKLEDLINIALGTADQNTVNYKMIQTVLHILARQMRMLETQVEIKLDEISPGGMKGRRGRDSDSSDSSDRTTKASTRKKDKGKESRGKKKEREESTKEKANRDASKEKDRAAAKDKTDRAVSKDREKSEKDAEKGGTAASKIKDKTERATAKEKDNADKDADRFEKGKADKAAEKEKVKKVGDKEKSAKEGEKADKAAAKEAKKADKAEKASAKEDEKEKRATKAGKEKGTRGPTSSGTSIIITETERQKDKVLVVEKGPTTRTDSRRRVGSIEVVTVSQFELLESAVKELKSVAGPLPTPALPDNQKLRTDIAKGRASLTDTMKAVQLVARIEAAENAIGRMADLITELAAQGVIPEGLVGVVQDVKAGVKDTAAAAAALGITEMAGRPSTVPRKSVAIDAMALPPSDSQDHLDMISRKSVASRASTVAGAPGRPSTATSRSVASRQSMVSTLDPAVSHKEMDGALQSLKNDITKTMNTLTTKAAASAEAAVAMSRAASGKAEIADKLNNRISILNSLVSDYAEQLSGFDAGLSTQMMSFQEQMAQMRTDLKGGLTILEQVNSSGETAAVKELTQRYESLVSELDVTLHAHHSLTSFQRQLSDDLQKLLERVEMLQEQKADRDEVQDGLRDKADLSRLAGLLTEQMFAAARVELERRLELCHDKFNRQEIIWMGALRELTQITDDKAEIMQLLATREEAQTHLREIHERLRKLAEILGDPMAAIITRALSRDATCGACGIPALMGQTDISYGAPPPLPAFRPRPAGAPAEPEQPCFEDWMPLKSPNARTHTCLRWVGGSHTLMSDAVTREKAEPIALQSHPTKQYAGYGSDGRLYMMEEELQPCMECNVLGTDEKPDEVLPAEIPLGAGDGVQAKCECP